MKNLTKIFTAVLASLFACAVIPQANAVPIQGTIGFIGSGSGTTNGTTSTVSFNNPMKVSVGFGDYSGVPVNTPVNFNTITWTGMGLGAVLVSPIGQEWTFFDAVTNSTYSFDLNSLNDASITGGAISLNGNGTLFISGAINRDPTSATFAVQGTGSNFQFVILTASNTAVPEGGAAIAFFGIGLVVIELVRRKVRFA